MRRAILVVSFRCLLDRCGRGKLLNLGFAISAAFSILLGATWMTAVNAAAWLNGARVFLARGEPA